MRATRQTRVCRPRLSGYPAARMTEPRVGSFTHEGFRLVYDEFGSGPRHLVLLPGLLLPCSRTAAVPHMQVGHEHQEWGVDRRDVVGEPFRQLDVGDRADVGAVPLRGLGERASKPLPTNTKALPVTTAAATPTRLSVRPTNPV